MEEKKKANSGLSYKNSKYRPSVFIDKERQEDIEKHFVEDNIRFAILCSPHNPAGRVWERWELEKFVELCVKNSSIAYF